MPNEEFKIGVLAFQGGYAAHIAHLQRLGIASILVKTQADLKHCKGLILPGGESTTINHHLKMGGMFNALLDFASEKPLFGTCAGLIIMAQQNILPLNIARNAYGRQSASFRTLLSVNFPYGSKKCEAIFIRAPQILSLHNVPITVLASYQKQPVFVQYLHHLGATFHPELTSDLSCHEYFVNICHNLKSSASKEKVLK